MEDLLKNISTELFETAGTTATFCCLHGGPINYFTRFGQPAVNPATARLAGLSSGTTLRLPFASPENASVAPVEPTNETAAAEENAEQKDLLKKVVSKNTRELYCANVGDSEAYLLFDTLLSIFYYSFNFLNLFHFSAL